MKTYGDLIKACVEEFTQFINVKYPTSHDDMIGGYGEGYKVEIDEDGANVSIWIKVQHEKHSPTYYCSHEAWNESLNDLWLDEFESIGNSLAVNYHMGLIGHALVNKFCKPFIDECNRIREEVNNTEIDD